jgi:hypothetical protein
VEPSPREDIAGLGSISVSSSVDGASVYLDDELVGEAPVTRDIPAGRHRVRVESAGHEPFETDVRVRAEQRAEVEASLDPSHRASASKAMCLAPRSFSTATTSARLRSISSQSQRASTAHGLGRRLRHARRDRHVESGHRDIRVSFKNIALNESIAVVHKHRMGPAKGSSLQTIRTSL